MYPEPNERNQNCGYDLDSQRLGWEMGPCHESVANVMCKKRAGEINDIARFLQEQFKIESLVLSYLRNSVHGHCSSLRIQMHILPISIHILDIQFSMIYSNILNVIDDNLDQTCIRLLLPDMINTLSAYLEHDKMTRTYCIYYCKGQNTTLGLVRFDTCYCINTLPTHVVTTTSDCNRACSGDSLQTCGGTDDLYFTVINGIMLPKGFPFHQFNYTYISTMSILV